MMLFGEPRYISIRQGGGWLECQHSFDEVEIHRGGYGGWAIYYFGHSILFPWRCGFAMVVFLFSDKSYLGIHTSQGVVNGF